MLESGAVLGEIGDVGEGAPLLLNGDEEDDMMPGFLSCYRAKYWLAFKSMEPRRTDRKSS